MIELERVEEVRRLLAEGALSYRAIARITGISRGTIGAIASGKRPDLRKRSEEKDEVLEGPLERCPACGGYVYMPCRLCRVRSMLCRLPVRRLPDRSLEPLHLELTDEQQARYERIHAQRRAHPELEFVAEGGAASSGSSCAMQ